MDKPGQRPAAGRTDLIIERPDLQTPWQKYSYGFFTFIAWTLWIYLWLPLISFIGWLLGIKVFYEHMILLGGYKGLLDLLGVYFSIIFLIGLTLSLWAFYNQLRFRGKERREAIPRTRSEEVARFFGVSREDLQIAQQAKRLVISFDEEGEAIRIN